MVASPTIQTTEYFVQQHTANKQVVLRVLRLSDNFVLDASDNTFKTNAAACDLPHFAAEELTDVGDATNSQYKAAVDIGNLTKGLQPEQYVFQFRSNLDGVHTIISTITSWVANSRRIDRPEMRL